MEDRLHDTEMSLSCCGELRVSEMLCGIWKGKKWYIFPWSCLGRVHEGAGSLESRKQKAVGYRRDTGQM